MSVTLFQYIFAGALLATVAIKFWLAQRQIRHVHAHRDTVPARFAGKIELAAHQKAADYTIGKTQFGVIEDIFNALFLVLLTICGGIELTAETLRPMTGNGMAFQIGVVVAILVLISLIDLPFSLYRQFRLEQRFGFNKMSLRLFFTDIVKGVALGAIAGLPLLAVILWLMSATGGWWWLYAWVVWVGFNLLMLVLYPTVIAPLFNRFVPLADASLKTRIEALLKRCGFASKGVYVMDGSKRSAHGNAYFTGLGSAKRIVFFDTLIECLTPEEVEAVLAHELGHFKHRHVAKRIILTFAISLAGLALLGWLANQTWFYEGLGVEPSLTARNDGLALILFFLISPIFTFLLSPLASAASRRHEYQADAFAAAQTAPFHLVSALVKLYQDNAATLSPDPVHSAFYDSHPPAALRIERLDPAKPDSSRADPHEMNPRAASLPA